VLRVVVACVSPLFYLMVLEKLALDFGDEATLA